MIHQEVLAQYCDIAAEQYQKDAKTCPELAEHFNRQAEKASETARNIREARAVYWVDSYLGFQPYA